MQKPITDMTFQGPLFIIGLPRSGTKLLRDLLNRHPDISMPTSESHFIPYIVNQLNGKIPESKHELQLFYNLFTNTTFFLNLKNREGKTMPQESILGQELPTSWEVLFETILKFYGSNPQAKIYGDKTPEYVKHVSLLRKLFPSCRFIHIIRDPRDYCASVRNIWGKSIYRAAATWTQAIRSAQNESKAFKHDFFEIRYEELLANPETTMQKISEFLQIPYHPDMISLEKPSENYGDAKGISKIVNTNMQKYKTKLSIKEIERIEQITYNTMKNLGYQEEYAHEELPISPLQKNALACHDAFASINFHVKEKGLLRGIDYFLKLHKTRQA